MKHTIVRMEFGSTVYGTRLPTSDTDIKSVIIPPLRDLILGRVKDTQHIKTKQDERAKNTADDVDEEIFTLRRYTDLLAEGQTVAVDMLFVPREHWTTGPKYIWEALQANRNKFLHSGSASFVGYCRQQANKYGIKGSRVAAMRAFYEYLSQQNPSLRLRDIWPDLARLAYYHDHMDIDLMVDLPGQVRFMTVCNRKFGETATVKYVLPQAKEILDQYGQRSLQAEQNEGVDWKALSHAVRIAEQAVELLSTGHVTFPRPEAHLLLQIRKGELPYKQVAEMVEQGIERVEEAASRSFLPKAADREWIDNFVVSAYRSSYY